MDITQSPKNIPTIFVIFGATGDLMAKKITPALFQLFIKGKLPNMFRIIGFSRREWGDIEFQNHIKKILLEHKVKVKSEDVERFLKYFVYQKGSFDDKDSYKNLAEYLGMVDGEWKACSNKLFYLAVPPQNYESIFTHLKSSNLTLPCGPDEGWTRVIVEKPFGRNATTAERLDLMLGDLFKEEQIYRIDHYLGKEMTQNMLSFRFNNDLFEDLWSNANIEKIEIKFLEKIGISGRGEFYDGVGALRDVGQNHVLQLLALITMDRPKSLSAEDVRDSRVKVLENLNVLKNTFRAQYQSYKKEEKISQDSETETYFKILAEINSSRWKGVDILLEGGKKIEARKEVVIYFKHKTPCLCPDDNHYQNKIIFSIEPKEGITIDFWAKKPGLENSLIKEKFNYLFRDARKKIQFIEEYEKLLLDCIMGNQLLFVSTKEVAAMWNFIDPIIDMWEANKVPLINYKDLSKQILKEAKF
jgi:glucose-6-phosphate 1-dehydrogenase